MTFCYTSHPHTTHHTPHMTSVAVAVSKRKPEDACYPSGVEKKAYFLPQPQPQPQPPVKRSSLSDLSNLNETVAQHPLSKRARSVHPRYKSSNVRINLSGKSTYTQADLEQILQHLTKLHQAELDEQYHIFQTIIEEHLSMCLKGPASYIN